MGLLQSIRVALSCLAANKLRSVLTMLGVIIGVASVIVMVSIIEGARHQVVKEFEEMGSRLIVIFFSPDKRERGEGQTHIEYLTVKDAEAIRRECPLVSEISPELPMDDTLFEVGGEKVKGKLVGCQPEYARLHNTKLAQGRFFSREHYEEWGKVCVVGHAIAEDLWPDESAVGKTLRAHGVTFTVIGVAEKRGRTMGENPDENVYAPLTTCQKRVTGDDRVWVMWAQTPSVEQTEEAATRSGRS